MVVSRGNFEKQTWFVFFFLEMMWHLQIQNVALKRAPLFGLYRGISSHDIFGNFRYHGYGWEYFWESTYLGALMINPNIEDELLFFCWLRLISGGPGLRSNFLRLWMVFFTWGDGSSSQSQGGEGGLEHKCTVSQGMILTQVSFWPTGKHIWSCFLLAKIKRAGLSVNKRFGF